MGNILTAILAYAKLVRSNPGKRRPKLPTFFAPPCMRRLSHRLLLEGIHPAEAANTLLIEHNGSTRLGTGFIFIIKHFEARFDQLFEAHHIRVIHTFLFAGLISPSIGTMSENERQRFNIGGSPMALTKPSLKQVDPMWSRIRAEAEDVTQNEPLMAAMVHSGILYHKSLESVLSFRLAQKLSSEDMPELILREILDEAYAKQSALIEAARADIMAVYERDPACHRLIQPLLFFKGFQAVQAYRLSHYLWQENRKDLAYFVQMRTSEIFGVDIHPGARVGQGLMIDHAHSIVIGETAVVGDNVSMLHSVTLGGTGKEEEDRHPKIGNGVLIGAGAAVLGNIHVGHCSRIASGSVVLHEVPPCKTVAGVPAKIVGEAGCSEPAKSMDQLLKGQIETI